MSPASLVLWLARVSVFALDLFFKQTGGSLCKTSASDGCLSHCCFDNVMNWVLIKMSVASLQIPFYGLQENIHALT
jgi:hypothetical protein